MIVSLSAHFQKKHPDCFREEGCRMYLPSEKAKLTMYSLERLGKPLLLNPPEAERLNLLQEFWGTNKQKHMGFLFIMFSTYCNQNILNGGQNHFDEEKTTRHSSKKKNTHPPNIMVQ